MLSHRLSTHANPSSLSSFQKPYILVLIGLMGAGKTTLGRALAQFYSIPFIDADSEIEHAAGCSIAEIFERHGEAHFREGEHRVIKRLLKNGPAIIATGGGAWMDERTRQCVHNTKGALSLWLDVPLPILLQRVLNSPHKRPLLKVKNPREKLRELSEKRNPFYSEADITITCGLNTIEGTIHQIHQHLQDYFSSSFLENIMPHPTPSHTHKVPVTLHHHTYHVYIGHHLLQHQEAHKNTLISHLKIPHAIIITDDNVAHHHLHPLETLLSQAKIRFKSFIVTAGEQSKSLTIYSALIEKILNENIERSTTIIALGGGVIGDLAGFIASTTLRGLPFIQIPTTLLAQVDSSVGGKTGINAQSGKNLIGAFWQPNLVLADITTLSTLPMRQLMAGYAEIVKSGLIADIDLFAWCEENGSKILQGETKTLCEAVKRACAFKARIVIEDEKEQAPENGRALLNLGHSFAHALEAEYHYDGQLLHGEAVSIGLHLALAFSVKAGFAPKADLDRLDHHLQSLNMPMGIQDLPTKPRAKTLIAHMMRDKKIKNGRLSFILLRGIGNAFTTCDIEMETVESFLIEEGFST